MDDARREVLARPFSGAGPAVQDDGITRVVWWLACVLLGILLAASALLAGVFFYGLATWRRWSWKELLGAAVLGVVVVILIAHPGPALERHLTALRELGAVHDLSTRELIASRWRGWLLGQLPLGIPLGALLAAWPRWKVTSVSAHELSSSGIRRRAAEDAAVARAARKRAAQAPLRHKSRPILGAYVSGDTELRSGPWCAAPSLGLGTVVLGLPGSGKTETLLRLAQLGLAEGRSVYVLDAKGERSTMHRFVSLATSMGVQSVFSFPVEPYDGFRGDGSAIRNRLERVVDYSEPYFQDGARVLLAAACNGSPPRSLAELLTRLQQTSVPDLDPAVRKGTVARYKSFATAVADGLDHGWAFEDATAGYLLLDGVALGADSARLARFFVEDFAHFASARKHPERKALLLIDEFSALRLENASALLERLRSFGVGVVLAAQSVEGLHDDANERARILNAASCLIAHRLADPEAIATRAGTIRRAERSHQLSPEGPTGQGSLRLQDTFKADPNEMRSLATGMAYVISGGRAAKVAIGQARGGQAPLASSPQRGGVVLSFGPGDPGLHPTEQARRGPRAYEPAGEVSALSEASDDGETEAALVPDWRDKV
jgi:hypothetical protein